MKCAILFAGYGPILITTNYNSLDDPRLLKRLAEKGIDKFIAFELSEQTVRQRYGRQFQIAAEDLTETDELRVLDFDNDRVFSRFDFTEFGPPIFHETAEKQLAT
jgi:hypothetical protein